MTSQKILTDLPASEQATVLGGAERTTGRLPMKNTHTHEIHTKGLGKCKEGNRRLGVAGGRTVAAFFEEVTYKLKPKG